MKIQIWDLETFKLVEGYRCCSLGLYSVLGIKHACNFRTLFIVDTSVDVCFRVDIPHLGY